MEITELGMVIDVKPLHSRNAFSPMVITVLGITVFLQPAISVLVAVSMMALQSLRLSYTVFPVSTCIDVRPLQPWNALPSMEITELGIVMDVKPLQLLNAAIAMVVTVLGITVFLQPAISVLVAVSMMALQSLRLSYTVFPVSTCIDVRPLQP